MGSNMRTHSFVAIDFETATINRMACQVGIVSVKDREVVEKVSYFIQPPENRHDGHHIKVHHITPEMTKDAPTFEELWPSISHFFSGAPLVAHKISTDKRILLKNLDYYGIMLMGLLPTICTYEKHEGKGLSDLCIAFGMPCDNHHDALFDAECYAHPQTI